MLPFSMNRLKLKQKTCPLLTGIDFQTLESLIDFLVKGQKDDGQITRENMEDQILLIIVRLKHNLKFELLPFPCGIGKTTSIEYFWKWVDIMAIKLKFLIKMQDRDHIFDTIPAVFKAKFPRLTSIIDCFEVFIESPGNLLARPQCYRTYKKHCTVKVFISCTPLGAINCLSKCWGGRASDIQIVRESNFKSSKYHYPGDEILADRGFTL